MDFSNKHFKHYGRCSELEEMQLVDWNYIFHYAFVCCLLCLQWVALMGGYALMEVDHLVLLNPKRFYGEKNVFIQSNSLVYAYKYCPKSCDGELVNLRCIRPIWSSRFKQLIEIVCFISRIGDCFVTYLVLHHSNSAMTVGQV